MSCHVMSCHAMPCHVMSCHVMSCHVISYHIISYHIISYHIMSCHVISYHIISYHIISYHIISYHIISYHIISYHIISYHIISYHTWTVWPRMSPYPQSAFFRMSRCRAELLLHVAPLLHLALLRRDFVKDWQASVVDEHGPLSVAGNKVVDEHFGRFYLSSVWFSYSGLG